jgi:branched-chain amino acid transport system ATP-binding protein
MLSLTGIGKNFGGLVVLDNVNLTIPSRGIFGLIGPNGAGKTTLFNLVSGILTPNRGVIEFDGRPLSGLAPFQITRRGIARTFQNIRIFREMTLVDNLLVALGERGGGGILSLMLPVSRQRRAARIELDTALELLTQVGLVEKAGRPAGTLSYGDQRRLEIARALATRPKLLLLDEPAAGMNSAEKVLLMDEILKLEDSGLSLLIIEHDMRFIMGLCQQIAVLDFGRLIALGKPAEIRSNPAVIEAYLGVDDTFHEENGGRS